MLTVIFLVGEGRCADNKYGKEVCVAIVLLRHSSDD